MSRLTYEQITELVNYNEKENTHFMPNEIFEDLQNNLSKSPHIAFGYSYYYLISWLYRNTKYSDHHIDVKAIKQLLGYSPTTKTVNHIIKKGGVMDFIGYTDQTSNYPIMWTFDNDLKSPEFTLVNDLSEHEQLAYKKARGNRFTVKYPIKHMHIDQQDYEEDMKTGVYYDVFNTHMIEFETFIHCISIEELGTNGFYLYSYLKMMNQKHGGGYDIALRSNEEEDTDGLEEESGLSYMTLNRTLDALKKYRLIDTIHNQEYFSLAMDDRKANTYITNDPEIFSFEPQDYKKMEIKTAEEHDEIIKKRLKFKKKPEKVDISLEELPY